MVLDFRSPGAPFAGAPAGRIARGLPAAVAFAPPGPRRTLAPHATKPHETRAMSTYNSKSSGRRSNRGPRRRRERDDYRPAESTPRLPEKKSLWQRIMSIFSPKKASSSGSRGSSPRPAQQQQSSRPTSTVSSSYPGSSAPRQTRKPEAVDVTTPKLYVGNLSFDATESDLSELFGGVGAVQNVDIVSHKDTERSKGFGFVTMTSVDEAKRAVEVLHDQEFMGRKLVVSGAKTPIDR